MQITFKPVTKIKTHTWLKKRGISEATINKLDIYECSKFFPKLEKDVRLGLLAGQVHHSSAAPPMASRLGAAPSKLSFGDSAAPLVPGLHEIERAGSVCTLPARAISTKNKHLLVIYAIPTRGFTAAVSVFRGTPPTKPFSCKIWFRHSGALDRDRWANPTGGEPRLSRAHFRFVPGDII